MQHFYKRGMTFAAALLVLSIFAAAQNQQQFKARLSLVPPLGVQPAAVVGSGSATAVLSGKKLTINGSFDKLASAATIAHLSMGAVKGVRGDSIFDLTVTKTGTGNTGTIAGSFDLTTEQVDALKKGRIYIQLHSEGAPNGHLMGWLLTDPKK
jgi:CHRD domain